MKERAMSSNLTLTTETRERIFEERQNLLDAGTIRPEERMEKEYALFQRRFGYDVLQNLTGEDLIESIFNTMNKESLAYWLEYKNDDSFDTMQYGSVSGGGAHKYIIYKRKVDQRWVTGAKEELEVGEAIRRGEEIRNAILHGADFIRDLQVNGQDDYHQLQLRLDNLKIGQYGWIHKYYHMLYPDRICPYHSTRYQQHTLYCLGIKPESDQLYLLTGQITRLLRELPMRSCHAMRALVELYGPPVSYYRIGTTMGDSGTSMWDVMGGHSCVAIGWSELGDLRRYGPEGEAETKDKIRIEFEQHYAKDKRAEGRQVNEIFRFYSGIKEKDIVVACDGQTMLGIGEVTGDYEFNDKLDFPHTRSVAWRISDSKGLPIIKEGLRSTVRQLRDSNNILAIRQLIENARDKKVEEQFAPPGQAPTPARVLPPLDEDVRRVEAILDRKNQVILYGPPGTGKTYLAEKAACELAARQRFNKEFAALTKLEEDELMGNGRSGGFVRFCCFHPSYGYEDFIEGIKPRVADGHTLFDLRDGIFKKLCDDANGDRDHKYYLIVDEINRGDISRIFGELITLLETNKRDKKIALPVSGFPFSVPPNVYIIGTMNTADRSIALLDVALRRRFGFMELMPDYRLLENLRVHTLPVDKWLQLLNQRICAQLGKDGKNLQIGHSYFMGPKVSQYDVFRKILAEDILPLIEEYCYGDYEKIADILGPRFVDTDKKALRYQFLDSPDVEVINALLWIRSDIALEDAGSTNSGEGESTEDDDEDEEQSSDDGEAKE